MAVFAAMVEPKATQGVGKINSIALEERTNEMVDNACVKFCRLENCYNEGQVKVDFPIADLARAAGACAGAFMGDIFKTLLISNAVCALAAVVKASLANDLCLDLALAVGGYAENRKKQGAVSAPTRAIIVEDPSPVVKGMHDEGVGARPPGPEPPQP
eukprot:4311961-Pyramimonas_sp.AAC.1